MRIRRNASVAPLHNGLEQGFNRRRAGLCDHAGHLFALVEHHQRRAPRDLQLIDDVGIAVSVPIDPHDRDFPVFRLAVEQRTHGALLRAAGPSPGGEEIQHERFAARFCRRKRLRRVFNVRCRACGKTLRTDCGDSNHRRENQQVASLHLQQSFDKMDKNGVRRRQASGMTARLLPL
jgi:hypothetical protein